MKKLHDEVKKIKKDLRKITSPIKEEDLKGFTSTLNQIEKKVKIQHQIENQVGKICDKIDEMNLSLENALNNKPKK